MGGLQVYWASIPCICCGFPSRRTHTPLVSGLESGEIELRSGGHQVIAQTLGIIEKGLGQDATHGMIALVGVIGIAASIAKPSGLRVI